MTADLNEVKARFPKGYSPPRADNNAFESNDLVNLKNQAHGVNTNHGWKLHADLKAELTQEDAFAKMGLKLKDPSKGIMGGADVIDQELFSNFQKRTSALGVNLAGMDSRERLKWFYKFMLRAGERGAEKFVDPNDTLRLVELLGENDIGFKTSSAYRPGRQFTFYAQTIEERDRIIGIVEGSDLFDRLEDQYDPNYRKTVDYNVEQKNAPISQKTSGRFTTDYLNPYYVDDNGRPYLDLQHDPHSGEVKDRPGKTPATAAQVEQNKRMIIAGTLDAADIEAIEQVKNNFPEMDELLSGKPGYTTPYSTIEDQIAWRQANGVLGKYPGTIDGLAAAAARDAARAAGRPYFDQPTVTTGPTPGSVPSQPTVTTGPTPGSVPSQPTVTTGPTPGSVPSQPTVTTGPTPGSVPSQPTVTTGPTPGSVPSQPTVTTGETPGRKPIGRPVIDANTPSPPPTAAQARETAEKVTKSGNATPPPQATIHSNAPTPPRPSSGAPAKVPGRLRAAADDLSAAVTQGPNGARNLKMLGIAGALGLAGFGMSRARGLAQDDEEARRRLEMQRRGTM